MLDRRDYFFGGNILIWKKLLYQSPKPVHGIPRQENQAGIKHKGGNCNDCLISSPDEL